MTTKCEACGAEVPVDPGYLTWCECGWNLRPTEGRRPGTGLVGPLYEALSQRRAEALAALVIRDPEHRLPLRRAFLAAASVVVLLTGPLVALLGVALLWAKFPNPLAILLAVIAGLVAWGVRPRIGHVQGEEADPSEHPELLALVDRVARAIGVEPPARVLLGPWANAFVMHSGWRQERVLGIGLPLWAALDAQQRVALIGHELGHYAARDPSRSVLVGSALRTLDAWYRITAPTDLLEGSGGVVSLAAANLLGAAVSQVPRALAVAMVHLAHDDSQVAEYRADHLAARVGGTEASTGLLETLSAVDPALDLAVQRVAVKSTARTVHHELRALLAARPARERERHRRIALLERSRLDATHPPTAMRIGVLRARPMDPAIVLDDATSARIDAELAVVEDRIGRDLAGAYAWKVLR
jgi:Zn-dependent protease with chaperone function